MSKIKIKTLSPIHIGSGELLQNNTDFVVEPGHDPQIHIVDELKIFNLIGEDKIHEWLISIERKESTANLIKRLSPDSSFSDYTKISIASYARNINPDATLKEQIHNGMGLPYIPGSSIKGAIRTAVLASLTEEKEAKALAESIIVRRKGQVLTDRFGNKRLSAEEVEKELFGKDPNSDVFRFIRVGDAYFKKDDLIATRMVNINITNRSDLMGYRSPQLIEAIDVDMESEFQLNIAKEYYEWVRDKFSTVGKLTDDFNTIDRLFMLINNHTKKLIEYEYEYWKEIDKTGAEIYIEIMEELLGEISSCKKGESCVLRIGHGSGWRFITGAWTEKLDNFYPDIPNAARPRNNRYSDYDFPKTRRLDEDSEVLGFVKLSIAD